jgi:FMN reductase
MPVAFIGPPQVVLVRTPIYDHVGGRGARRRDNKPSSVHVGIVAAVTSVAAIDGSPAGSGRTATVLRAVVAAAGAEATPDPVVSVAAAGTDAAVDAVEAADAVVVGSPVYRASYAHPLKDLLDHLPRGMWGEDRAPLRGKAVCIVATGASLHHFLALDDLRSVLAGFFAAHVVPPGLYVPREGFGEDGSLLDPYAGQAKLQGAALRELAQALAASSALRRVEPQA